MYYHGLRIVCANNTFKSKDVITAGGNPKRRVEICWLHMHLDCHPSRHGQLVDKLLVLTSVTSAARHATATRVVERSTVTGVTSLFNERAVKRPKVDCATLKRNTSIRITVPDVVFVTIAAIFIKIALALASGIGQAITWII